MKTRFISRVVALYMYIFSSFAMCGIDLDDINVQPDTRVQDLLSAQNYLDKIGYNVQDREFPLLIEAVTHFLDSEHYPITSTELNRASAILAFSFGIVAETDGEFSPGPTNQGLAKIATDLHNQTMLPVYAQWPVAESAHDDFNYIVDYAAYSLDSFLTAKEMITRLENKGLIHKGETLIVVANYDHGFRIRKLLEKKGYNVLFGSNMYIPSGGWEQQFDVDNGFGYSNESAQIWTKTRANFISEEVYWLINDLYLGYLD